MNNRLKKECPACGGRMSHVGEKEYDSKMNNHTRQLWECNNCGHGPVERG